MPTQYKHVTQEIVQHLFPEKNSLRNVNKHFTAVRKALEKYGLTSPELQLVAYATIRAESAAFAPIIERESKFNTRYANGIEIPVEFNGGGIVNTEISWDGTIIPKKRIKINLYEGRSSPKDLGNTALGDGVNYMGRGFVQLTGKVRYKLYGDILGENLVENPDLALDPDIAAKLLALYISYNRPQIERALKKGDLKAARKAVNGGSNGLDKFIEAFNKGKKLIEPKIEQVPLKQKHINLP